MGKLQEMDAMGVQAMSHIRSNFSHSFDDNKIVIMSKNTSYQ